MTQTNTNNHPKELSVTNNIDPNMQSVEDLKHSVLIVSVVINLAILTTWIMLQVTKQFDSQLVALIFDR